MSYCIEARFIRKDGSLSDKTYTYKLPKSASTFFIKCIKNFIDLGENVEITNEKDYNYRGSKVKIIRLIDDEQFYDEHENCLAIIKIKTNNSIFNWRDGILNKNINNIKKEGKNNMSNSINSIIKNFNFGKAYDVKMSIYGPAFAIVNNEDRSIKDWISYDKKNDNFIDASAFIFDDLDSMCYIVPIPANDIKVGDFIRHDCHWVRVRDFDNNNNPIVEKIATKEIVTILPIKSPFGFDFYSKLISIMDFGEFGSPNSSSPFGNMLIPLILSNGNNNGINDILPIMFMSNDANNNNDFSKLLPFFLLNNNKNADSMALIMLMMSGANPFNRANEA